MVLQSRWSFFIYSNCLRAVVPDPSPTNRILNTTSRLDFLQHCFSHSKPFLRPKPSRLNSFVWISGPTITSPTLSFNTPRHPLSYQMRPPLPILSPTRPTPQPVLVQLKALFKHQEVFYFFCETFYFSHNHGLNFTPIRTSVYWTQFIIYILPHIFH